MIPLALADKAAALAGRIGVRGLIMVGLGAALAVQTVRLEGLYIWPLSIDGWVKVAVDRQAAIDRMTEAQQLAGATAKAARLEREAAYREIAERIDENAKDQLGSGMAAAERFIAAGGVRAEAACRSSGSARTGTKDQGASRAEGTSRAPQLDAAAGVPGGDVSDGYVTVIAKDVLTCTDNTIKAEAGHAMATELEAASRP